MPNPERRPERKIQKIFFVSEEEDELIKKKMRICGTKNFSMYARKMLIDGYIIKRDYSELKELTHELANLSRSINQIARRTNETRSIYAQDVEDLRTYYANVKRAVSERLVKMIRSDGL